MKGFNKASKIALGLTSSALFIYFALHSLDFHQMKQAFSDANYWFLIPSIIILFASHWLRSLRWQILLKPNKKIDIRSLFSALMIGYSVNTILPAHLGEFVRAYIIGKKRTISVSSAFATIVVERIIDVVSIILIMAVALIIYPFPEWIRRSGYLLVFIGISMTLLLLFVKIYTETTMKFIRFLLGLLPDRLHIVNDKLDSMCHSFLKGLKGMDKKSDYLIILTLTILIWSCYLLVLYINFYTFNLIFKYNLTLTASIVILVFTTVSIIVPSSPGYIGTYHFLCQFALGLFKVPKAIGLSYALVVHAIEFFMIFFIGMLLAWKEGIHISKVRLEEGMG